MNAMELAKKAWELVEAWGPDFVTLMNQIKDTIQEDPDRVTFCGICGEECPVFVITVEGKKIFRGKCPEHGFKR